ncbi:hypothetical protein BH11CYA1_BH11CYA1_46860 [soil metagenome]
MKHIETIQPTISSIANARKAKSLTQTELGRKLGLPQSYVSRLESGGLDIRLSTTIEIARYLGFEVMLVPKTMATVVNSLLASGGHARPDVRPLYTLDELDDDGPERA